MSTAVPMLPLPLRDGDRMTRDEFLRRWEALPDLKHAELIDGVVHMPSPVLSLHDRFHGLIFAWLFYYELATPGCVSGLEGTWLMLPESAPQPDATLRILPECGGQSRIIDRYFTGAPELVIEVGYSSLVRDLNVKGDLYRRSGAREYLVIGAADGAVTWREVVQQRYRKLPSKDAIIRSRVFPGLWLDTDAVARQDFPAMRATLDKGLASPEHASFVKHLAKQRS